MLHLILSDDMSSKFSASRFQTMVGERLKSQTRRIVARCLLGVSNIKGDVIECNEFSSVRLVF